MTAYVLLAALVVVAAGAAYVGLITGALTLDLGLGRSTQPLRPLATTIASPRERVFDLFVLPYVAEQPPRALREKVTVLERSESMVLAAHRTKLPVVTAVTVETVTWERPHAVSFRLVRGPVPAVVEHFTLHEAGEGTEIRYVGEIATDFWGLGRVWGAIVARTWVKTVEKSLATLKLACER